MDPSLAQDRQARNKPLSTIHPNTTTTGSTSRTNNPSTTTTTNNADPPNPPLTPFEAHAHRAAAARVLDSPELLLFHALAAEESGPQTRLRFERRLVGYPEDEGEQWPDRNEELVPRHHHHHHHHGGGSGGGSGSGSGSGAGAGEGSKKRTR